MARGLADSASPRVLVVDDDAGVRYTLRETLATLPGVAVDEAADGELALQRLAEQPAPWS
jgi:two-component system response regulator HydG